MCQSDAFMRAHGCSRFFSSRRRHTRYIDDWSSDVCSSDLLDGKTYPGKHKPLVTIEDFDHVQKILRRPGRPRKTERFSYTGMITCGECGFMVTGEEKINRWGTHYSYYHCSKRRLDRHCNQKYLSVEEIEAQIAAFLETIRLPDPFHRWVMRRLERTVQQKQKDHATQKDSLLRDQATT